MSREPKKAVTGQEPAVVQEVSSVVTVENALTGEQSPSTVIRKTTKFYRGMFANKSDPNDPDKVVLSINGEPITWQRGVEVIVPDCYLSCAEDARYAKYSVKPNEGRKVAAYISRFPFTKTGEATYEEFKKMFKDGTAKTREAVSIHGLRIPIAQSVPQLA